jgi:hypothetical protein
MGGTIPSLIKIKYNLTMNRPINQVFLGGDPYHSIDDIDMQIQNMETYRNKLQQLKALQSQQPNKLIWDDIDAELSPMSEEQKSRLFNDSEYIEVYTKINNIVQAEILNLVKAKIESSSEGKDLLSQQLRIVKRLKKDIISETNREMELFKKFKEYSKMNPEITYEDFIKNNL